MIITMTIIIKFKNNNELIKSRDLHTNCRAWGNHWPFSKELGAGACWSKRADKAKGRQIYVRQFHVGAGECGTAVEIYWNRWNCCSSYVPEVNVFELDVWLLQPNDDAHVYVETIERSRRKSSILVLRTWRFFLES